MGYIFVTKSGHQYIGNKIKKTKKKSAMLF